MLRPFFVAARAHRTRRAGAIVEHRFITPPIWSKTPVYGRPYATIRPKAPPLAEAAWPPLAPHSAAVLRLILEQDCQPVPGLGVFEGGKPYQRAVVFAVRPLR